MSGEQGSGGGDAAVLARRLDERHGLHRVLEGAVRHLRDVWRAAEALFPYSVSVRDGAYVRDYRRPDAVRYTLNTLLGLGRAARAGTFGIEAGEVKELLHAANEAHAPTVDNVADLGMLVLLNTDDALDEGGHGVAEAALRRLERAIGERPASSLTMQDLAWTIWGACSAARRGVPGAERVATAAAALVEREYVHASGLPRHSVRRYRRDIVSFGSLTYFLRAMHELAATLDAPRAASHFTRAFGRVRSLQGPLGEWPWLMHVPTGKIIDPYPVFSVHQDSMAMLFCLPALHRDPTVAAVVERSVAWCFGENELRAPFYHEAPFMAGRSIERVEGERRAIRYARSLLVARGVAEGRFHSASARMNAECRSYHLGWLLFAWAGPLTTAG